VTELGQPRLPVIGARAQAVENLGHFARHRRLPFAEELPREIYQEKVVAEREPFGYPLTRGIEPPPLRVAFGSKRLIDSESLEIVP
jgi:hypothetical protein